MNSWVWVCNFVNSKLNGDQEHELSWSWWDWSLYAHACLELPWIAINLHYLAWGMMNMMNWAPNFTCMHDFHEFHDYKYHLYHLKQDWSQKLTCIHDWWKYGACMRLNAWVWELMKRIQNDFANGPWFWTIGLIFLMSSCYIMCSHVL